MKTQHERRIDEDRRKSVQCSYRGPERRGSLIDRRSAIAEFIKEIAASFGVRPDSLEVVRGDDLMTNTSYCQSCVEKAIRCAELETELAESREEVARYKKRLEDAPLSFNNLQ